ncbi:hypothetical protein GYMLUDRAFT_262602 [Collybiopsis luxurians FD-317 M1]|uniref:Uncharacterized protein n=1 Tax=Collybiopsis luxurians FD-317 M1 TaxID=944289 RepID=A0A0D0CRN1_9AGAR|nr:hypothetical protein GYMLUDRAFT_262602 [Collybiopsis luxurians FD-317 M1]
MGWVEVKIGPRLSQITQITQAIYAHRQLPVPAPIDHWWHSPQIKYLVQNPNAPEPEICIINLGEGEPDCPSMSTHFMINLNMMRVTDKFSGQKFPAPNEIRNLLGEIRDYAVQEYRREKEAGEQFTRKEQERREAELRKERADISAFHQKLVENHVISQAEIDNVVAGQTKPNFCPVCVATHQAHQKPPPSLVKCIGCKSYLCLTTNCKAHELDDAKRCLQHPNEVYCKECILVPIEGSSTPEPRLRSCPDEECGNWMCKQDWKWCLGEPVDSAEAIGAEELEESKEDQPQVKKRKKEPQPRHDRRLAPCSSCLKFEDSGVGWTQCKSGRCWNKSGLVCPDCSPDGGEQCIKEHVWICDLCVMGSLPPVWQCPSCGSWFCDKCKRIERCHGCGESQFCQDCVTATREGEEVGKSTSGPYDVELYHACSFDACDLRLCEACRDKGDEVVECGSCSEHFCDDHIEDRCGACGLPLCSSCARRECSCGGMGAGQLEQVAMEIMYGSEYDPEWF